MGSNQQPQVRTDELLEAIWRAGLLLLGDEVRRQYGLATPIFIDLRHRLYEDVSLLRRLGEALHRKICQIARNPGRPQQVIGIPDTATPLALSTAMASLETPQPLLYAQLRKRPAAYPGGTSGVSAFMGTWQPGREVTLIDDVMASGRSKLWAIEELAKDGIRVERILVVVDREQGGDQILAAKGYHTYSLYTVRRILDYYVETGKVEPAAARDALEHLRTRQFR
jgi:uridine monophosphate synthetase